MACNIAMNPHSESLRTAMPNAHVANFLQGRQDIPTLLGTIEYLDAKLAELECRKHPIHSTKKERD